MVQVSLEVSHYHTFYNICSKIENEQKLPISKSETIRTFFPALYYFFRLHYLLLNPISYPYRLPKFQRKVRILFETSFKILQLIFMINK